METPIVKKVLCIAHNKYLLQDYQDIGTIGTFHIVDKNTKQTIERMQIARKSFKQKPNLERILKSNIGYVDFKRIRISPDYVHQLKKNFFAMICQLGPPTFFVTFTSVEQN